MEQNEDQNNENQSIETETLTKSERNVLKQQVKKEGKEKEIRNRKIKKTVLWVVVAVLVAGGVYGIARLIQNSNDARPGEAIPIVGRTHISVGDPHKAYNSNPPTSGPHAAPAPWGFSEQELIDENLVHNLEHGGIWISYKNLDDESINTLRDIARRNRTSVVISLREANDVNVAVASWGRLLKLDVVDEAAIDEFIRININKSPERLAI